MDENDTARFRMRDYTIWSAAVVFAATDKLDTIQVEKRNINEYNFSGRVAKDKMVINKDVYEYLVELLKSVADAVAGNKRVTKDIKDAYLSAIGNSNIEKFYDDLVNERMEQFKP